jgi:hypothetical protein
MFMLKLPKTKRPASPPKRRFSVGWARLGGLVLLLFAQAQAAAPDPAAEVDVHQLHLPRSYLRYLPQMLDGARLMAADETCSEFISGKLSLDRSSLSHPVFHYLCRDSQGDTYRWYVDGKSLQVLDDTRAGGNISFAQLAQEYEQKREAERQRAAERQAAIDALQRQRQAVAEQREQEQKRREQLRAEQAERRRRDQLWQNCQQQLETQTAHMIERQWLTTERPAIEESASGVRFSVDFNALNLAGTLLQYRAYCRGEPEGNEVTVSIHPRALAITRERAESSSSASASAE